MNQKAKAVFNSIVSDYGVPLAITVISFIVVLSGTTGSTLLRYDRDAILAGELWRLLTGHFVHLGWKHFIMNIAGLVLIWLLFGRFLTTLKWITCIVINALLISAGFLVLNPELHWYVGLSGVLHGMFVCGAIASIATGYRAEALLLLLLVGKLIWEQLAGALPGSAAFAGGAVVVDAHLYGAMIGLVSAFFLVRKPAAPV
jgi:rhomboid family GlyGly-CTERM serine protease